MRVIDFYASQPNYWRHLAPIVEEARRRGHDARTWASRGSHPWGAMVRHSALCGDVLVVASYVDARKRGPGRRVVYVEHGAGQTYRDGRPECYAGAAGLGNVVLFLAPAERVAQIWRQSYPQTPVETVGCPALDQHLHPLRPYYARTQAKPVVYVSSHWDCGVVPETRPAIFEFERGIQALARLQDLVELRGHAHPRLSQPMLGLLERNGIGFEVDPDVVLRTADLLIHDNSSLMFEAAACDVPVLALNAAGYRRHVEHGLRFWSHVPGIQCSTVGTFLPSVIAALDDPPEAKALRARAASHAYDLRDGTSAARAVDAIEKVM